MERFIGTHIASFELFFNIFTPRIETFVIPWDLLVYPCDVEVCPLWLGALYYLILISASLSIWKPWRWPYRNFLRWTKRWPQLSMLTPCVLLCVLVSVALAHIWHTIFWTTGTPWQFCAGNLQELTAGTGQDEFWSALCSVRSKQTALNSRRELK